MSEPVPGGASAGRLLRQAREAQGLHIAALAAAIKVAPRKLDALENDRWSELPDPAFTRALAQTVCRTLRIEPRPVLELLPAAPATLERPPGGLDAPFRQRAGRDQPGLAAAAIRPMVGAALLLMVAAVVVHFLPDGWIGGVGVGSSPPAATISAPVVAGPQPAASTATPVFDPSPAPLTVPAVPMPAAAGASTAAAAATPPTTPLVAPAAVAAVPVPVAPATAAADTAQRLLQLRTSQASWIELRDARGQLLLSRVVHPGENLGFDASPPLKLTVGNPAATQVAFRGRAVDLGAWAGVGNVARLELQ